MGVSAPIPCPVCGKGTMTRHCPDPHPTCTWDICRTCRATVDRVTGQHPHMAHVGCLKCGVAAAK